MKSKQQRKAERKNQAKFEQVSYRAKKLALEKWNKEYYESRAEYPVTATKKKKSLTWTQIKRFIKPH